MTNSMIASNYYVKKVDLLKRCLALSEELLSIQLEDDWPLLDDLFSKREAVIQSLEKLDEDFDREVITSCSQAQNSKIDQLVNLIMEIDKDLERLIVQEQDKIFESMKSNTQEQKIADYTAINTAQGGNYLDIKK